MSRHANLAEWTTANRQLNDPALLVKIAHRAEAYSRRAPAHLNKQDQYFHERGAMILAEQAFGASDNLAEILEYIRRCLADDRFNAGTRPIDFFRGSPRPPIAGGTMAGLQSLLDDPSRIAPRTTHADLAVLQKGLDDYLREVKYDCEVSAASKTFYSANFFHEERSIQTFLARGYEASEASIYEARRRGEEQLNAGDFWSALGEFTFARDLNGLNQLYFAMLKWGRPLDAVYASLAMEWIRTGRSPFPSTDSANALISF